VRVIVTGGAGFLGRYVVDRLREMEFEVVSVDIDSQAGETVLLDVRDLMKVTAILSTVKPDIVIHLAALAGSRGKSAGGESIHEPYAYFETNVVGTLNVFEACRLQGVKKVIYMSSLSPHGSFKGPINETCPLVPTNPYGFSKACGEFVAKCYASNYDIKTLIFKAPLLAGEHQTEQNALQEFVLSAKRRQPVVVYGDGNHVREWLHPIDVAEAFVKGIAYFDSMTSPYEIFVLGGKPIPMKELARLITNTVGGNIQYVPDSNLVDQRTDTTKVTTRLKWKPSIYVEEIVKRVVAELNSSP
jgi:nucleoside-diphosphate-sugar epimerase